MIQDEDVRELFERLVADEPALHLDATRAVVAGRAARRRRASYVGGGAVLASALAVVGAVVVPPLVSSHRQAAPMTSFTNPPGTPTRPAITTSPSASSSESPEMAEALARAQAELASADVRARTAAEAVELQRKLATRMVLVDLRLGGPAEPAFVHSTIYLPGGISIETLARSATVQGKHVSVEVALPQKQPVGELNVCAIPDAANPWSQCQRTDLGSGVTVLTARHVAPDAHSGDTHAWRWSIEMGSSTWSSAGTIPASPLAISSAS